MSLALYRQYRPGTLAEVVGQEHVTEPLGRALDSGRIHHAFLFSGPRGCGKTSTARILARSLNCVEGPTSQPCGECDSCIGLAPNGPGSDDVIELDAASHGGVDDTRELRSRVIYTPAKSRYRVYIIDEAHMVTKAGFNALLKTIEEPPEFARFVFATTEPEKVLPTIRSRTYNYAFRLVPTSILSGHLARVCESEGIPCDESALTRVAKASGGSVRDALSILGQLIAGSGPEGLTDAYVVTALGVTDSVLLDDVVAAMASRDGALIFAVVERVIESGHDPRRFVTDLLERLRDLVVIVNVPNADHPALLEIPPEQVDALRAQANAFGPAQLSRAAHLVSEGLTQVKGATAPRLQLELLMARLLLPEADADGAGLAARLERLENQLAATAIHPRGVVAPDPGRVPTEPVAAPPQEARRSVAAPAHPEESPAVAAPPAPSDRAEADPAASQPAEPAAESGEQRPPGQAARRSARPGGPSHAASSKGAPSAPPAPPAPPRLSAVQARNRGGSPDPEPTTAPSAGASDAAAAEQAWPPSPPSQPGNAEQDLSRIQQAWERVLQALGERGRVAWTLWAASTPIELRDGVLTVQVAESGRLRRLSQSRHDELLRQVIIDTLSLDVRVKPVAPGGETGVAADPIPAGPRSPDPTGAASDSDDGARAQRAQVETSPQGQPPVAEPRDDPRAARSSAPAGPRKPSPPSPSPRNASPRSRAVPAESGRSRDEDPQGGASRDDPDLADSHLAGEELLAKELGAVPIGEIGKG